jgi:hypothetical protein
MFRSSLPPMSSNIRARDKKPKKYTIDTSRFYANPLLANAHFFIKDTNRFNIFLLKKLDIYNNMKKAYTFLEQSASFKGSSVQFQKIYSGNTCKIDFYTFSNHSISHKWPIFLRKQFFVSPEKLAKRSWSYITLFEYYNSLQLNQIPY